MNLKSLTAKVTVDNGIWFLMIGLVLWFLIIHPVMQVLYLPESYVVELPPFKGRTFPADQVKPGTFTLAKDFESISEWSDNGILTYSIYSKSKVILKAWRPDEKTSGVFDYAQELIAAPNDWGIYHQAKIEKTGDRLVILPVRDPAGAAIVFLGVVVLCAVCFLWYKVSF